MLYAGIVELCPCIRLTFRDSRRLIDSLKKNDPSTKHHIWHECSITEYLYVVRIKIVPVPELGQLLIETQYDIGPR